jgi:hypothetical protein
MTSMIKHIAMVLVVSGLVGGLYYIMNYTDAFSSTMRTIENIEATSARIEREVLVNIQQLQGVTFDGSMFREDIYLSLQDIRQPIEAVDVSRVDPFASL